MSGEKIGKILVVEDDNDSREALVAMLETLGHHPTAFSSGKEALEKVGSANFDIALLDIMMPEMNGYQLLEELRKVPAFAEMPVIMVTAKDQDDEIIEGYQHGADYYITKPYTVRQLEYGIKIFLYKE
jgi:DNA-binding response OmpR family regulator